MVVCYSVVVLGKGSVTLTKKYIKAEESPGHYARATDELGHGEHLAW